jgi:AcrR family transcriptional regulator
MDGFARRKEQSKEDIRRAAWELFTRFGVDKASIADIARKAGVSQATIYNNFGSKEVLAREFVTASVEHLMSSVQEILTHKKSYNEKMAGFFQFISDMMASGRPSGSENAIFTSSVDLLNDPEIRKIRTEAQKKMTALLLQLIEEGKQQGQVSPDLSEEALHVYFAVFMDVFTNPELQRQFYKRPAIIQEIGALMLYGLNGQRA